MQHCSRGTSLRSECPNGWHAFQVCKESHISLATHRTWNEAVHQWFSSRRYIKAHSSRIFLIVSARKVVSIMLLLSLSFLQNVWCDGTAMIMDISNSSINRLLLLIMPYTGANEMMKAPTNSSYRLILVDRCDGAHPRSFPAIIGALEWASFQLLENWKCWWEYVYKKYPPLERVEQCTQTTSIH